MPTVSYLTLLDTYILACFIWLFFVACQNSIVTLLADHPSLERFQDASALAIVGSWLFLHVVVPLKARERCPACPLWKIRIRPPCAVIEARQDSLSSFALSARR